MTRLEHILLINPTITSRRSARFPLAVLNLSAALDGRYASSIIDGNVDRDFVATTLRKLGGGSVDAVGVSVMGGPQLRTAIEVSRAIRAGFPAIPIIWGGHFPTICATAALNTPYVDYAIRGQGEATLCELLDALFGAGGGGARAHAGAHAHANANANADAGAGAGARTGGGARAGFHAGAGADAVAAVLGLSWRAGELIVHNPNRAFSAASLSRTLPYERVGNPRQYLARTYLGRRTTGYQAALGCRFRCSFCGVAAMFRGKTALPAPQRLERDLEFLTTQLGVDAVQFYDHNFFDREEETEPMLEVLAKFRLPWWCFARSDALLNLSARSWSLVRKSRLRMAYIGAESPSDWLLHDVRKGTRTDQTLAAVETCRTHGVTPELSFMLAPPQDPEGETERTFEFIRQIKRVPAAGARRQQCARRTRDGHIARSSRRASPISDHRGRLGRAAVDRLLVPHGHSVDHSAAAQSHSRFHDRARLPVPHHHGHPLALLGEVGAARARRVALSLSALRASVGTRFFEALHPALGSAGVRPIGPILRERHRCQKK
jgi:radical SAM superfamily enzyme YgiQ (UPF0313 family)